MRLTEAQSCELLRVHGAHVTEACYKCGGALGPIRFTHQGNRGAWCSRACRDGVDLNPAVCRGCGTSLVGKRRGATYCGRTIRMRKVRNEVLSSAISSTRRYKRQELQTRFQGLAVTISIQDGGKDRKGERTCRMTAFGCARASSEKIGSSIAQDHDG